MFYELIIQDFAIFCKVEIGVKNKKVKKDWKINIKRSWKPIKFSHYPDRLWAKYGKDDPVIETVEFYPPNGYNSAEVGFLYKGYSDTKSIVSLLIYLADKGYLKIEETSYGYEEETRQINDDKKQAARLKIQELENKIEQEKLKDINSPKIKIWENSLKIYRNIEKSTDYQVSENAKNLLNNARKDLNLKFRIIKLKEYDGNNEYEKIFFDGLFMPGSDKTSINISDLYNRFYITLDRIKEKLNSKQNKNKIFEESSNKQGIKIIPMIIAIFALITIKPVIEYSGIESLIISLIFPTIGLCVLGAILLSESTTSSKIIGIIFALLFGGIPWKIAVLPALKENNMYLITYIVGIICVATLILFIKIMPKRTPYGNEMLGKVRGFKRFLETAEKPQLEGLVERNPEYFYNILPYTYALEVSNVWIKQFETIAIQEPEWYKTDEDFDLHSFGIFIDETMSSASNAMSPSPSRDSDSSSSISSSSSGGGISGGGSGGGGGGSW